MCWLCGSQEWWIGMAPESVESMSMMIPPPLSVVLNNTNDDDEVTDLEALDHQSPPLALSVYHHHPLNNINLWEQEQYQSAESSQDQRSKSCYIHKTSHHRTRVAWTKEEQKLFLMGLEKLGKGDWKGISNMVGTKTPEQVRNHAYSYIRHKKTAAMAPPHTKRRSSIFDIALDPSSAQSQEQYQSQGLEYPPPPLNYFPWPPSSSSSSASLVEIPRSSRPSLQPNSSKMMKMIHPNPNDNFHHLRAAAPSAAVVSIGEFPAVPTPISMIMTPPPYNSYVWPRPNAKPPRSTINSPFNVLNKAI